MVHLLSRIINRTKCLGKIQYFVVEKNPQTFPPYFRAKKTVCLTCSLGSEGEDLAVLAEAVLVLACYPDVVMLGGGQVLEEVLPREEVISVIPGADPHLLGPLGGGGVG